MSVLAASIAEALAEASERVLYTPEERVRYRTLDGTLTAKGEPRLVSVPGVTTILNTLNKPALVRWAPRCMGDHLRAALAGGAPMTEELIAEAQRAPEDRRDEGAAIGSRAHDAIHAWLAGDPWETYLPDDEAARNATLAALAWVREQRPEVIGAEVTVVDPDSDVVRWAGTTDLVAIIDGRVSVIDWKSTKKGLFDEVLPQLGAYAYAVEGAMRAAGLSTYVEQTVAVHVCRETARPFPLVRSREEWQGDADGFLEIAGVHRRCKQSARVIRAHKAQVAKAKKVAS